ncbi:hypothetical protein B0T18DRAFT_433575 [Schizothecium vesticola]|uniref:Uncharacterized protein n=1 Tax=Schizothecium vesticola TaxID=314040 RepID=A0AA40BR78_9PEZI|nr:hypothetical protein B0T18DRAFT_433575 [Schizothecium vesticola]
MPRKWHVDGSSPDGLKKIAYDSEERIWTFLCLRTGGIFHGDRDDGGNLTRLTSATSRPPAPSLPEDYEATLQRNLSATAAAGGWTYVCPITGNVYDRERNEPQAPFPHQQLLPAPPGGESSASRDAVQPVSRSNPSSTSRSAAQPVPRRNLSSTSRSTVERPPRRNLSSTSRGAAQPPPRRPPYQHVPVSTNEQHVTMQFYGQPINNIPPPPRSYYPGTYYHPSGACGQGQGYLPPPPNPAAAPAPEPVAPASSAVRRPMRKRSLLRMCFDALLKRDRDA